MTDRNEVIERVAKAFADNGHESVCDWDWCVDGVKAEYRADAALIVGKIEETHLLIRKPETVPDGLRDPKTMTLWDLAQAIAVNSDIATHFYAKREENDPSDENYRVACEHYQRRNDCVAEIRDREAAHVLVEKDRWDRTWNALRYLIDYGGVTERFMGLKPGDLEPIRHDAAESDTSARP